MSYDYPRARRTRVFNFDPGVVAVVAVIVAIIIVVLVWFFAGYSQLKTRVATICDKEAVATSSGGHQYRVYTSNGTFRVSDTLVDGARFNSADTYGRLVRGKTYVLTYYGYRFGLSSSFPNIKSVAMAAPDQQQPNACN